MIGGSPGQWITIAKTSGTSEARFVFFLFLVGTQYVFVLTTATILNVFGISSEWHECETNVL